MNETQRSQYEKGFFRVWLLICVVGSAAAAVFGVWGGGEGGYYVAGKLGDLFNISAESLDFFSDFLASVLMGVVAGAVESLIQWIVLRRFLSRANWWVLAGILGSSIGNAFSRAALSPSLDSTSSEAAFLSLFCCSLLISTSLVGLFKGYLEWLVLRKDFPTSAKWMRARMITQLIALPINFLDLWIRNTVAQTLGGIAFSLLVFGALDGIIFAAITGPLLEEFIRLRHAVD